MQVLPLAKDVSLEIWEAIHNEVEDKELTPGTNYVIISDETESAKFTVCVEVLFDYCKGDRDTPEHGEYKYQEVTIDQIFIFDNLDWGHVPSPEYMKQLNTIINE